MQFTKGKHLNVPIARPLSHKKEVLTNTLKQIIKEKLSHVLIVNTKVLQKHIKTAHEYEGQKFPCPHCEYKTAEKGSLWVHIKSIHKGETYPCPRCGKIFKWKHHIQPHIKSFHMGKIFPCPHYCEKTFTHKVNLVTHIKSIHEGVTYPCPHCEQKLTKKVSLQRHINSIHGGETSETLLCPHCDKMFTEIDRLQKHRKSCQNQIDDGFEKSEEYFENEYDKKPEAVSVPCKIRVNNVSVEAESKKIKIKEYVEYDDNHSDVKEEIIKSSVFI